MPTQVTQSLPPQYIQDIITRSGTGLYAQLDQALGTEYQPYEGDRVAGFSGDQLAAFDLARQNVGTAAPYADTAAQQLALSQQALQTGAQTGLAALPEAANLTRAATQAPTAANLAAFQDPHQQQVIDATIADLNRQYQVGQTGSDAQAVAAGAFGGSRHGVADAESYRNLADVTARTVANLRSQGYSQALQGFQQQQANQLAGAGQLAGFGSQAAQLYGGEAAGLQSLAGSQQQLGAYGQQATAADIALLTQTGAQQQQQVQTGLDAAYQEFLARQEYEDPFRRVGFYSDIIQGTPSGYSTITQSPDPSTTSQVVGAGIAAAGLYDAFTN